MAKAEKTSGNGRPQKKRRRSVYSGIGGQAVLEGVMMRNRSEYAVAVRRPDKQIDVKICETEYDPKALKRRIPFVRGIVSFVESLKLGMDMLTYSSSFYEEEQKESAGDRLLEKIFGEKAEDVVMGITVFCSMVVAVVLFMLLPYVASELLGRVLHRQSLVLLAEGVLRILIFVAYVTGIALMKDIRRLYQYHGAEHKCINCVETGRPLTVENVMKSSRFHKRCGTSFLLFVVMLGVIACFFIRTETLWMRIAIRILLIPVIAAVAYELLQLAGKKDSFFLTVISAPGIWLQHLTTKEPDESMVEVAIAATEAVFDWEAFQHKYFSTKKVRKTRTEADGHEVETGEETIEISILEVADALSRADASSVEEDWRVRH
ncbi:MAG: DUF1385 domain-containing protein [Lachnospiraceae bacterium]|nr:DUF1385 domain-containing protein [Lachnospiraceae bacterium]